MPPTRLPRRSPAVNGDRPQPTFVNLAGDYRYLRAGYWALIDAELNGVPSSPTPLQAATSQNTAACLLVAERAGITCASWRVAASAAEVHRPAILLKVAGQTQVTYKVEAEAARGRQWRRATQNGTRPVLSIHATGTLRHMKVVLGQTTGPQYRLAWELWRLFGLPLMRVAYLDDPKTGTPLFVAIDPLFLHDLTPRELRLIEEVSQRPMSLS